jgi:hypothetical protein
VHGAKRGGVPKIGGWMTPTLEAIERALSSGKYRVDVERGLVYGPPGVPLGTKPTGTSMYGLVGLSVSGMSRSQLALNTHKVVAYAIWGRAAVARGIHVRHLNNNPTDNRKANLALGSAHENLLDAPRRRALSGSGARGRAKVGAAGAPCSPTRRRGGCTSGLVPKSSTCRTGGCGMAPCARYHGPISEKRICLRRSGRRMI